MHHQELRGRDGADDEDRDLGEQRKLARLEAVVLAEHQRDESRGGGDVPDPGERNVPLRPGDPHAAQPGHQIVAFADEEGGKRPEDHAVDVHRPQPAEGGFQAGAEIVGIVEESRQEHAHRGGDQQPEHAPVEPCLDAPPVDQCVKIDAGKFATQQCPRLRHGVLPQKRSAIAARNLLGPIVPGSGSPLPGRVTFSTRALPSSAREAG